MQLGSLICLSSRKVEKEETITGGGWGEISRFIILVFMSAYQTVRMKTNHVLVERLLCWNGLKYVSIGTPRRKGSHT